MPFLIHTYTLFYTHEHIHYMPIYVYTIQLYDHRGETWADFTHMETVNLAKRPGMCLGIDACVCMFMMIIYVH